MRMEGSLEAIARIEAQLGKLQELIAPLLRAIAELETDLAEVKAEAIRQQEASC